MRHHYVCPPCRAAYKRPPPWEGPTGVCPRCRREVLYAGDALAVPRRSDAAGWRVLTTLLHAGVGFRSSCCWGPGWRPRTPREVRERLTAAGRTGMPVARALVSRDVPGVARRRQGRIAST
ncbi:deoxyxylulose-5-phosphate synthase [Streptomyces avicenniae]|uniref:deoxyxylulose-5-phosphate synthase n=1 Tax=Streptomyces avicenniae TaxID=500153 RepID=UPI00069CB060|nr:deoxyxylulose-5-phosphate synthase [Streptomyces avicenniae]